MNTINGMIDPESPIPTEHSPRRIFDTSDTKNPARSFVSFVSFVGPSPPLRAFEPWLQKQTANYFAAGT